MSELKLTRPRIEIQPIGKYYETDEMGYLLPMASLEKIDSKFKPILREVIDGYIEVVGDDLHSIYLRGSVANGTATEVSDLDTWCFRTSDHGYPGLRGVEDRILAAYPFINFVEMSTREVDLQDQAKTLLMSICLWGEDMRGFTPRLRPGVDMALRGNSNRIQERLGDWTRRLRTDQDDEALRSNIEWLSKELLRVGSELAMIHSGRFTRDLYLCAKEIAEQYPDFADVACRILDLALNPGGDRDEIKSMLEPFVGFCFYEAKNLGVSSSIST